MNFDEWLELKYKIMELISKGEVDKAKELAKTEPRGYGTEFFEKCLRGVNSK